MRKAWPMDDEKDVLTRGSEAPTGGKPDISGVHLVATNSVPASPGGLRSDERRAHGRSV